MTHEIALPNVSVVLPTYNRLHTLRRTLSAYFELDGVGEVVLVLDGCTDGTNTWAREQQSRFGERLRIVELERRVKLPAARNAGLEAARGELVLFGEDDLVFGKDYVPLCWQAMREAGAALAAGRLISVSPDEDWAAAEARSRLKRGRLSFGPRQLSIDYSLMSDQAYEWPLPHACFLVRRDAALAARFDEAAFSGGSCKREESDFALRLAKTGARLLFCPQAHAFHVAHQGLGGCREGSVLADTYWLIVNNWRFFGRHGQYLIDRFGWKATPRRLQLWWAARLGIGLCGRRLASIFQIDSPH